MLSLQATYSGRRSTTGLKAERITILDDSGGVRAAGLISTVTDTPLEVGVMAQASRVSLTTAKFGCLCQHVVDAHLLIWVKLAEFSKGTRATAEADG